MLPQYPYEYIKLILNADFFLSIKVYETRWNVFEIS